MKGTYGAPSVWGLIQMKRCAMLLEWNPETKREEWRIIHDPTIGDIRSLRNKGAVILRQVVYRCGKDIHKDWVADNGRIAVSRIDFNVD